MSNNFNAERKQTEEALRKSKEFAENLIAAMQDGFSVLDKDGVHQNVNTVFCQMTGFTRDELIGIGPPHPYWPEEAFEDIEQAFQKSLQGNFEDFELIFKRKNGQRFPVIVSPSWLKDDEGNVISYFATVKDITERKKAEEELRRVNRALRTISECNQALIRATDESELVNEICRIIVEFGGYRLAWIGYAVKDKQKTVRPVAQAGYEDEYLDSVNVTWADTERGRGPTGTAIRTEKPSICQNILTDPQYASWRAQAIKRGYASSIALPLIYSDQKFGSLNIYAVEHDAFDHEEVKLLTELANDVAYGIEALRARFERERAEEALRASEEKFRSLFNDALDMIHIVDENGRTIDANRTELDTMEYDRNEYIGKSLLDIVHPDYHQNTKKNLASVMKGEGGRRYETALITKSGKKIDVEVNVVPQLKDGKFVAARAIIRDITERKKMEETLKESEKRFRSLIDNSPFSVWTCDSEGTINYANQAALNLFGVADPTQIIGEYNIHRDITEAEKPLLDYFEQAWAGEVVHFSQELDMTMVKYDTTLRKNLHIRSTIFPIPSSSGQRPNLVVIQEDITERKRREAELLKRRDENTKLVAIIKERGELQDWINTFDTFVGKFEPNGVGMIFNEAPIKAGGLTRDEVIGKYFPDTKWWSHSEIERARVVECFERAKAGLSSRIETNFRSADGTPVPIIFNCQPVMDDAGEVKYITAEGKTITEETRLRTELQEAKEALELRVRERTFELVETIEKLKREIAERKQAEAQIQHLQSVLMAIRNVNQLIVQEKNQKKLLQGACEILNQTRNYKFVWIGLVEESTKDIRPAAQAGFEEGYLKSIKVNWDDSETGKGPSTAIKTRKLFVMRDIVGDPRYKPWREKAIKRGYASSVAVPLVHENIVFGALNMYATIPDSFTVTIHRQYWEN